MIEKSIIEAVAFGWREEALKLARKMTVSERFSFRDILELTEDILDEVEG